MRPLHSWPAWLLHTVLRFGVMRGLWAEVWLELWHRAEEEANAAARGAVDRHHGPWSVAPPPGMH